MSTPSIQTLITQAQQVLNLKSSNEIRATLAAVLANANVGTPLNPNLTTQQLWDEFYEIVRQPSDDIMSIITDQMMRMVFSPPAPGGAGADKQVIFNDGGVLAGDAGLMYNKATDALTITGDLTVDTSTLKVDSTNDRVGIGTASPAAAAKLSVLGTTVVSASDFVNASTWSARFQAAANSQPSGIFLSGLASGGQVVPGSLHVEPVAASSRSALIATYSADSGVGYFAINRFSPSAGTTSQHFKIADDGVATWSNVGGVAGTAMTLNSTGLGIGDAPASGEKLTVLGSIYLKTANKLKLDNASNNFGASIHNIGASAQAALAFTLGATQAMTLDASGQLGVGTTTPDIFARFYTRSIGFNSTGSTMLQINGTSYGGVDLGAAGVRTFSLTSSATDANISTVTNIPMNFNINGATKMTLNTAGNLAFPSGQGIDFSATASGSGTMTSELLNDYEEGTWTATLKGATTDPTIAVTATGRYTKIGRQVTVQVYISNVVTTGASGRIGISGLPFANNGSTETVGDVGLYDIATFTGSPFAQIGFNATQVDLYSNISNSVYGTVTHNAGNARYLWFNMTYTV